MSKACFYCHDFRLRLRCPSALGGNFVQTTVLWWHALCPLSGVERCPLLGGSKCIIYMAKSIGGTGFVRCIEVVRSSECPLIEVLLYII